MPNLDLERASSPKLRERLLLKQLDRADRIVERIEFALQEGRSSGLSPGEVDLWSTTYDTQKRLRANAAKTLQVLRQQNDALREARPLEPSRTRQGFYRSEQERNAAILGILERERRRNAALSREDFSRAKATAASRGKYDVKQAYRVSGTSFSQGAAFRGEADFYDLHGVDVDSPTGVDPCVEYLRKQRNRREVMFARGFNLGWKSRKHFRSPC